MDYITVKNEVSTSFFEKRSEFICHVKPIKTNEEALDFINEKKQKYWDATHNVYAYILREGNIMRYSDDGEPQGTAGIPVLEVLKKENLCDLVVVITRYFGGIMLGGGGLVRAYSKGAKQAVESGKIIKMCMCNVFEINFEYTYHGKVISLISKFEGIVTDTQYTDNVCVRFYIKADKTDAFLKEITDQTNGLIIPFITDSIFSECKYAR